MIRHTVLFVYSDEVTPEKVLRAKEGMAYCYYSSGVLALDFGEDLGLVPTDFKLALEHDHRDREAWNEYNRNDTHHRVGEHIKAFTVPDRAARVDWPYDGPPAQRGGVLHTALYRWAPDLELKRKGEAQDAVKQLWKGIPSVRTLLVGDDVGWYPPNYDWIVEAHFEDVDGLREFNDHGAHEEVGKIFDEVLAPDGVAQIQHRMLAG
jgi:hypothetical protein